MALNYRFKVSIPNNKIFFPQRSTRKKRAFDQTKLLNRWKKLLKLYWVEQDSRSTHQLKFISRCSNNNLRPHATREFPQKKLLFCILFRNFFVLFQKNPRMIRASNYLNKRDEQKTQKKFLKRFFQLYGSRKSIGIWVNVFIKRGFNIIHEKCIDLQFRSCYFREYCYEAIHRKYSIKMKILTFFCYMQPSILYFNLD